MGVPRSRTRMVLNPFKPVRIPYYAVPYEHNPYSFFGVGIAENMDDTQTLMNGFMRMAIDNARFEWQPHHGSGRNKPSARARP